MNNQKRECEKVNIPPDIAVKAEEGDAIAQLNLGKAYYNLTSIKSHDTIAFEWIHRSAEQGNMEAQFRLGDLYALGYGTEKNYSDSYKWYTKAAIQGYKKALIRIHNLYQGDVKILCRGKLNSLEQHYNNGFRELFEWRLDEYKTILNHAIEHYTDLFKNCQSSNQNDISVQLNLAFLYQHGYGTKKCSRWAFEYYSLAAEQGNIDAQYNLGYLYQQYTNKKFNYRDAFKWYTKSAQGGNIAAQRCLAYFYLKGLATDINYEDALFWYTKAAKAGDSQSQVTLGKLYRKGNYYIRESLPMAVKWYTLAARQSNVVAQNCLSQLYQRGMLNNIELEEDMVEYITEDSMNNRLRTKLPLDISKIKDSLGFKEIDKLAKNALVGDGPAMFEIGLMYYHGNKGFAQDKDTGIKWIQNSANREHKDAQFMIAELYKIGDSIEQDYYKSAIWYRKIAKQKNHVAQCQVGLLYYEGLGVRKDPLEASKWFIWAADQENSNAQFNLGVLRLLGKGIRMDLSEAKEWFTKSAYQKNTPACYELGKMYLNGNDGLERNQKIGLLLLEFAARYDLGDAQLFLGDMYKNGDYVQKNLLKSIKYYAKAADSGNNKAQYKLALIYLNGDGVDHDYVKSYRLFKHAKESGNYDAVSLFETPALFILIMDDFSNSKVIDMFAEVTRKGIDDLSYKIASFYEHGMEDFTTNLNFDISYDKAKEWYLDASNKGDSRADYRLGDMYENGNGVEKNMTTAIYYYNRAVENRNCDAMYRLADMYLYGYGVDQNFLEAFHLYTKASNMGYMEATEIFTVLDEDMNFRPSSPVSRKKNTEELHDSERLIIMLEKVTEKGYAQLQYRLGGMYERYNNIPKAIKWFRLASEIDITDAFYWLGVFYEKGRGVKQNYTMAADMYQKVIEKDHEGACYRLGQLYQYGNGVQRDYLKAYSFYKKAADLDHEEASKILNITLKTKIQSNGRLNENFFVVQSKNYKKSLVMCKYVADNGDPEVQFQVGFAYEKSYSKPNYKEAFRWYSKAAKRSHREAMYHLGLIYEKGLGVSQNYLKAIRLYNQAHQLGSGDALHRLATVYHHGKGVDINPVKAVECYILSAKLGNPEYQCELGRLYEEGELVQKNPLEALKWYTKAYLEGYDNIGSKLYSMYKDKPYESFFFEKLFRNLSVASCNHFGLHEEVYNYEHYGNMNNQLGYMCFFGQGTRKNLKQSLVYFLKAYSDRPRKSIKDFGFFQYPGFTSNQKIDILNQFEKDEECMNLFNPEELYILGMVYYDGIPETQEISEKNNYKCYIPIDDQDLDDPNQHIVLEKDLKAWNFLKRAANKNHHGALFQSGVMCYYGYGVNKDKEQGDKYFDLVPHHDSHWLEKIALLYLTENSIQNSSKALEYYKKLERVDPITNTTRLSLGLLYEYGDSVEKDYQKALDYYKKVADTHDQIGYLRLGLMYYYGKGVPVDYKKAFNLIRKGFGGYDYPYPCVYDQNTIQTSKNSQKKMVYCVKTGVEIYGERDYYVGLIYKYGQGVPKDRDKAQGYFKEALKRGCQRARNEM